MRLIAHRGFANEHPENTIEAVQQAASQADMIELDLRRCRSGKLVVIHDGIVDAVTESRGQVNEFTASELRRLDVLGSGEGVPTFAAVLEHVSPSVGLNIELKERNLVSDVVAALEGTENEVVVSSSSIAVLEEAKRVDRSLETAFIFSTAPDKNLERARTLGCRYIQPHWSVCVATDLIDRAHELGLGVFVWSINTNLGASVLRFIGADGIIAETPVRASRYPAGGLFARRVQRKISVKLAYQLLRIFAFIAVILFVGRLERLRNWTVSKLMVVDRWNDRLPLFVVIILLAIGFLYLRRKLQAALLYVGWKLRAAGTDSSGRWRGKRKLSMSICRLRIRTTRLVTTTRVARSELFVNGFHLLIALGMLISYITLVVGWNLSGVLWTALRRMIGKSLPTVARRLITDRVGTR